MQVTRSAARSGRWLPVAIMLASLIAVTCAYAFLSEDAFVALFRESGVVETGTWLLYLVLVGVLLIYRSRLAQGPMPAVLAAAMLARELDLHRRFTPRGIFSGAFYTDPAIPVGLRIGVFVVLAVLAAAAVAFLVRIAPRLIAAMRRRSAFIWPLVAAAFLIGLSLTLDGVYRKLQTLFSITLPATANLYLIALEETAELLIPAMLLLTVWQGLAQSSRVTHPELAARREPERLGSLNSSADTRS